MDRKRALYLIFILSLWLPLAAVVLSPRFAGALRAVVANHAEWNRQKEVLRRSTPLWNGAVSLYNTLAYRMGSSGNRAIAVVGQDGWVFLGDIFNRNFSQAIGRRTLTPEELAGWTASLRGQEAYLRATGRAYLVVVMPAKWSVYRDKLPAWTVHDLKPTSFDKLLAVRPALPLIDLRPPLVAARGRADTYSKMNSHWTEFGGWVAWTPITQELARRAGDTGLRVPALGSIPVSYGRNEYDSMLGIRVPNRWTEFLPATRQPDYAIVGVGGQLHPVPWDTHTSLLDLPQTTRNPDARSKKKVLVFRDSSGDAMSPFLQGAFREVVQVGHALDVPAKRPDFVTTVEATSPDIVIMMLTERYLDTPPPQPLYWQLANAYYGTSARTLAAWTSTTPASGALVLSGDGLLSRSPVAADFSRIARSRSHSAIVQIRGAAAGAGKLGLAIKCPNAPERSESRDYHAGLNVYFFELRGGDCDGALVLQRREGSDFALQALSFRQQ